MFGKGNQQSQPPSQPQNQPQPPVQPQQPRQMPKQNSGGIGVTSPSAAKPDNDKKNNFADFWGQPAKEKQP